MATLIDTLLVSLKLDNDGFVNDAKKAVAENDKLSASIDDVDKSSANLTITIKGLSEEKKKAKEQTDNFTKSVNSATKALVGLFTAIFVSTGLTKLIDETAKTNDQLNFLSKNLGMNAAEVKRWQGAAEMSGGSADGMAASLSGLSKSLWDMVTMGDTSVLPYFNALNVGVIKSNGELRNLDDILLDVSDSLSKMSRPQAYNFAKNMGFDDGTINMLLQGRREVEEYLALQKDIVVSSEQELEISRQLNKQNALVSRQWEGLKTLLANYLMPYALKFSETISGFLNYLNRNRDTAVFVFKAIGTVIGVTLIPLALKAGIAFAAMLAPLFGGVGLVALLSLGFVALLDDFNAWKEGSKSLLDWSKWSKDTDRIKKAFDSIKDSVSSLTSKMLELIGIDTSKFSADWIFDKIVAGVRRASETLALLLDALNKLVDGDFGGAYDSLAGAAKTLVTGEKDGSVWDFFYGGVTNEHIEKHRANKLSAYRNIFGGLPEKLGLPLSSSDSFSASGVEVPHQQKRIYKTDNGDIVREGGSRSWRNNNPGNIIWGDYARKMGAIGHDEKSAGHVMAIFPTEEMGRIAKEQLIFQSGAYKNLTLSQAIERYAPEYNEKGERINDTPQYIKNALSSVGGSDRVMSSYNDDEQKAIISMMKKTEDWTVGKEYSANQVNALSNIRAFQKQISTPFAAGIGGLADNFLGQTSRLQNQQQTINNKVEANFGDININTTASTISGNIDDATQVATRQVYQMVSTMS
ncbi:hypothetical protein ACPW90_003773 [Providencia rettgeri]